MMCALTLFISGQAWAGYQGVWTDSSGKNHYSEPSSSSSSSSSSYSGSKGGILWQLFNPQPQVHIPKPPYDPSTDLSLKRKKARKHLKNSEWDLANAQAHSYLEQAGWSDSEMLFIFARSYDHQIQNFIMTGGRDDTWIEKHADVARVYGWLLDRKSYRKRARKYLDEWNDFKNKVYMELENDDAWDWEQDEQWEKAAAAYRRIIVLGESYPYAYARLGWCLVKMGKHTESIQISRKAISLGTKKAFVYGILAEALMKDGDSFDEAMKFINMGKKISPDTAYLHDIEGRIFGKLKRYTNAIKAYHRAIKLNPNEIRHKTSLVNLLLELGRLDEADKVLAQAMHENPGFDDLNYFTSELEHARKDKKEKAEAREISEWEDLSNNLIDSNQFEKALKLVEEAQEKFPDNTNMQLEETYIVEIMKLYKSNKKAAALVNRSHKLREANQLEESLTIALQAKEDFPNALTAHQAVGRTLTQMGRYDEADEIFGRAMYLDRSDTSLMLDQLKNKYEQGKVEGALFYAKYTLDFEPENEEVKAWKEKLELELYGPAGELAYRIAQEKSEYEAAQIELDADPKPSQDAWRQAKAVQEQSQKAARADSLEKAKTDSSIGFDTPVSPGELPEFDEESGEWSPRRREYEIRLQSLKDQPKIDTVAIANTKQAISDLNNQENYDAFMADEALRGGEDISRDAAANAALDLPKDSSVDVSEMSVGGQALTQADATKSDAQMRGIRQLAEDDLKQKMMDQHQDSIDGEKRRQADVEWMESDAQLKNTILKSDQLMQKAAEEYDRRQNNPTNSSPYGQVLLKDMLQTPDTQQWPGDRNTELPLKNPVAMERERELAILTIYQELKQGEVLMEAYDREDAKAVEVTE
ncbi:MAG: Flp pilus assembly protein TadD [Candidatus Omnitrophota bacterium]